MPSERKVAIVTGAARPWGMGRAAALALARCGMDIVVADLREDWGADAVKAIQGETGARALFARTDVAKKASIQEMVRRTLEELGRIDALLNIVGVGGNERIENVKEETFYRIMDVNLKGTILTCQAVIPAMRKQGGGRIVNTSSGGAFQPLKGNGVYAASKAGVVMFSKCLAWEVSRDNIIVTVVAPGIVTTAMGTEGGPTEADYARSARMQPTGKPLLPEHVADLFVFAATSTTPALNGQTLHANGGSYMV